MRSIYTAIIEEAVPGRTIAEYTEIEEIMRHDIFHSTLDWQTKEQLQEAARQAVLMLQPTVSPKGWESVQGGAALDDVALAASTPHEFVPEMKATGYCRRCGLVKDHEGAKHTHSQPLIAHEVPPEVQGYDDGAAMAEGWILADDSERGLEIQRFDESDRFPTDGAAAAGVQDMAKMGDVNAMAALRIIAAGRHPMTIDLTPQGGAALDDQAAEWPTCRKCGSNLADDDDVEQEICATCLAELRLAHSAYEAATIAVANLASTLVDEYDNPNEIEYNLEQLRNAIHDRGVKQHEFLRAVAGAPKTATEILREKVAEHNEKIQPEPAVNPNRVMVLTSTDGEDYLILVIPPTTLDDATAKELAAKIIEEAQQVDIDKWTWDEEMWPRFAAAGFTRPHTIVGPQWD